jgi:hypothetical protein
VKYLIHDRDASFGAAFDAVFTTAGIDVILRVPIIAASWDDAVSWG